MIISAVPVLAIDLIGSFAMIVLAFPCVVLANRLRKRDLDNVIWTYLLWVCISLACFAVSRSAGHIIKNILLISGHKAAWITLRPYSGSINSLSFVVVGAITLFFEQIWGVYQRILKDKGALQAAHTELLDLNQNLEHRVVQRTRELAVSEHKYRQIVEGSMDMILVTRTDGCVLDINPAGCKMLDVGDVNAVLGKTSFQTYLNDAGHWPALLDGLQSDGFITDVELDMQTAQGHVKRVLLSGALAKGTPDEPESIHFVVKDIEQRRRMHEQMAQADKLASIGELSSGIAHEINNPLGVILGYTQLLIRNEARQDSGSERHADLKTIEKHVRSCKTIVEDLLNFARTSSPKKEVADMHRIMDEVCTFVRHHADLDQVEIQRGYEGRLALLLDEKKIKQVLINLIMNARHAIGGKGTIRLSTELDKSGGTALIRVVDDGHGIAPKNLVKIFDPFFTTKPTGEGTGLGLSVSYGIIKNHGGEIRVQSQPGKGSTFTIALPLSAASEKGQAS